MEHFKCMRWPTISESFIHWPYLSVYNILPSFWIRSNRFGVVIQWASDFLEFRKNVSGIQILPTMLLFSMRIFIVPLNLNRLSYHDWAKKMSIVYSWKISGNIHYTCQFIDHSLLYFIITLSTAFALNNQHTSCTTEAFPAVHRNINNTHVQHEVS